MGGFSEFIAIRPKPGACALFACTVFFLFVVSGCKKEEAAPPPPPSVVTAVPLVQDVPVWQEWIGSLTGVVNASILPQVSGYVQSQDYQDGASVNKGQVLFRIDPSIYKDQLGQAQARLAEAQAQWKQADYNRNLYKPLAAENVVSKQKYEDAVLSAQSAQADILAAEAAVSLAARNLSYTTVVSPVDGVASIAAVQVGDLVSPSGKVMTTVSSIDPIRIDFAVTEREWLERSGKGEQGEQGGGVLEPGNELTVILSDGMVYPLKASVTAVGRAFASDTGTLSVQATVANEKSLLRPGMFVRVKSLAGMKKNALTVPQKAIFSTQGRFFVVVAGEGGRAEAVPVLAGPVQGINQVVEPVVSGALTPQSRVVIDGVQDAMMAASRGGVLLESGAEKNE